MLGKIRKFIPDTHPLRLLFHRIKASIAVLIYRFPASKMKVVGITGTNGKTTTTNFTTNILNVAGFKVGMTSTINFQVGKKRWVNDLKQTTLGPFAFQKILRQMVDAGCEYAVLEVSSHAMTQFRVLGVNIDLALFTNVSPEHIEYHGTFDSYLGAKMKLFKKVSKGPRKAGVPKVLIGNLDDKFYNEFDKYVADKKLSYGLNGGTVYASNIEKSPEGSSFDLHVPNNFIKVSLKLPGEYNIYNALAAASIALALNVSLKDIKKGLEDSTVVEGRFEHIDCGQDFSVIVDYAHMAESLENLLILYKKLTKGRVFIVFGATGGGRDKSKRPIMGRVADENADYIIVTNDDPYNENEWQIIEQVSKGIKRKEGDRFWKIPDRKEAIRLALTMAKKGDCVIVAGKGAEEVMMLRGKRIIWKDRIVIESLLNKPVEVELFENEVIKI